MSKNARLFLSSVAGQCFGSPLGWSIGWITTSWFWESIVGVLAGSTFMLVVSRLTSRLPPPEPRQAVQDGD